jgi:HSP20 family protein
MATPQQQESGKTDKQQQGQSKNIESQGNQQSSSGRGLARREQGGYPSPFGASPFSFMRQFSEQMDRLFEDFGFGSHGLTHGFGRGLMSDMGEFGRGLWSPQIETFEREGQLVIRADLPGLTKDDVNVELTDDAITISGERRNENEEKREGFYRSERSYGSFYRQIQLPEGVNGEDAKANFRDGVLEITMQAPQLKSQRRRLEISEGGGEERSKAQTSGR